MLILSMISGRRAMSNYDQPEYDRVYWGQICDEAGELIPFFQNDQIFSLEYSFSYQTLYLYCEKVIKWGSLIFQIDLDHKTVFSKGL